MNLENNIFVELMESLTDNQSFSKLSKVKKDLIELQTQISGLENIDKSIDQLKQIELLYKNVLENRNKVQF